MAESHTKPEMFIFKVALTAKMPSKIVKWLQDDLHTPPYIHETGYH